MSYELLVVTQLVSFSISHLSFSIITHSDKYQRHYSSLITYHSSLFGFEVIEDRLIAETGIGFGDRHDENFKLTHLIMLNRVRLLR